MDVIEPAESADETAISRNGVTTVCVSGYFDPLHTGHIEYLKNARKLADRVVVILNRNAQRPSRTRNRFSDDDRKAIVESLRYVDDVVMAIDKDGNVSETLRHVCPNIFAKGTTPSESEQRVCTENDIRVVTNVGSQIHLQDLLWELRQC